MTWRRALCAILMTATGLAPRTAAAQQATPNPQPVDLRAVMYVLRTMPPRDLLLLHVGPARYAALAPKIDRESSWDCAADNPRSSAAGLGQTIYSPGRATTLANLGLSWGEIAGPDCYADVVLIGLLYDACGLGPWTPPYSCLRPLPRT